MNPKIRGFLNKMSEKLGCAISNTAKSISSVCRMFFLSKLNVAKDSRHYSENKKFNNCTILWIKRSKCVFSI